MDVFSLRSTIFIDDESLYNILCNFFKSFLSQSIKRQCGILYYLLLFHFHVFVIIVEILDLRKKYAFLINFDCVSFVILMGLIEVSIIFRWSIVGW